MGKGKGGPEYWVAVVRPGTVMFELAGVPREAAAEAMRLAGSKHVRSGPSYCPADMEMSKRMKNSFKELKLTELSWQSVEELTKKYFDLRFQMVIGHVENPLQKRTMRRQIARLNTLICQHERVAHDDAGAKA